MWGVEFSYRWQVCAQTCSQLNPGKAPINVNGRTWAGEGQ